MPQKHALHVVVMASFNGKSTASQSPPPGSYPESLHILPPPSVVSTSVGVKNDVSRLLEETRMTSCTFKGESCFAIPKEEWKHLESQLIELQGRGGTSVPATELAELQRELSELRLKAHDFKSDNERLEYAKSTLSHQLEIAQARFESAKSDAEAARAQLDATQSDLRATLSKTKKVKAEYEEALRLAKAAGNASDVEKLADDKRRLSTDITELNNSLQHVNAERLRAATQLKRFEMRVIELTNELNLEKSRHSIVTRQEGRSFADLARAAGKETVRLYNVANSNLSALAKERFEHIADKPLDDEKNTAFWLKATFDACRHSVYRPYKIIFAGMANDMKAFTVKSRKLFDPFLLAVRDSLLPTGQPLTLEELNAMLEKIPPEQLELNKAYRDRGYRTFADLPDGFGELNSEPPADLPYKKVNGKMAFNPPAAKATFKLKGKGPLTKEEEVLESDPLLPTPSEGDPESSDDASYWSKMKKWFLLQFDNINSRVRGSLRKNPARLLRYFKLATGNLFQRICLIPYSWYIWVFP